MDDDGVPASRVAPGVTESHGREASSPGPGQLQLNNVPRVEGAALWTAASFGADPCGVGTPTAEALESERRGEREMSATPVLPSLLQSAPDTPEACGAAGTAPTDVPKTGAAVEVTVTSTGMLSESPVAASVALSGAEAEHRGASGRSMPRQKLAYLCGKCGQPKKGHTCTFAGQGRATAPVPAVTSVAMVAAASDTQRAKAAAVADVGNATVTTIDPAATSAKAAAAAVVGHVDSQAVAATGPGATTVRIPAGGAVYVSPAAAAAAVAATSATPGSDARVEGVGSGGVGARGPATVPREMDVRIEQLFNKALRQVCKRRKESEESVAGDVSLGHELDRVLRQYKLGGVERRLLQWHVANLEYGCGAPLHDVSLRHWDQDDAWAFGGSHCLIPAGYQRIICALGEGLDIRTGCSVTQIQWSGRGSRGHGRVGRARGRAAVVGREPQKKRRREEEEELVAAKEESVMCVGSFVSRSGGKSASTLGVQAGQCGHGKAGALESVTQALELSKGWSVTVEVKKGQHRWGGGDSKTDCDLVYVSPALDRFKSLTDVRRFLLDRSAHGEGGGGDARADALALLGRKLRGLCKAEWLDVGREECEQQMLASLGIQQPAAANLSAHFNCNAGQSNGNRSNGRNSNCNSVGPSPDSQDLAARFSGRRTAQAHPGAKQRKAGKGWWGGPIQSPQASVKCEEVEMGGRGSAVQGEERDQPTRQEQREGGQGTPVPEERTPSPLLPSLRIDKWLEEQEAVVEAEGGRVYKVGSDVEMLFSDGHWYAGWISKWLGDGKEKNSKIAVIDFEDGDRQKVDLPNVEVRPAGEGRTEEGRPAKGGMSAKKQRGEVGGRGLKGGEEEEDLFPVGAIVEMLFDDGVWYRGRVQTRTGARGTISFDDGDRRRCVFPDPEVRRILPNGKRLGGSGAVECANEGGGTKRGRQRGGDGGRGATVQGAEIEKVNSPPALNGHFEDSVMAGTSAVTAGTANGGGVVEMRGEQGEGESAGSGVVTVDGMGEVRVGDEVEVLFEDHVWYPGVISELRSRKGFAGAAGRGRVGGGGRGRTVQAVIDFDDGDQQVVNLPDDDVRCAPPEDAEDTQGLSVQLANGERLECDALVCTLPVGLLQEAEKSLFVPQLPQWKRAALGRAGNGLINKVILRFQRPFWDTSLDFFGSTSLSSEAQEEEERGEFFLYWSLFRCSGEATLIAISSGRAAVRLERLSDAEVVGLAIRQLRTLFGDEVAQPLQSRVTRWGSDPLARGAYSFVRVGGLGGADYDLLAEPVGGQIFFAGEGTCREHPATAAGAFLTGLREAARVHARFQGRSRGAGGC